MRDTCSFRFPFNKKKIKEEKNGEKKKVSVLAINSLVRDTSSLRFTKINKKRRKKKRSLKGVGTSDSLVRDTSSVCFTFNKSKPKEKS